MITGVGEFIFPVSRTAFENRTVLFAFIPSERNFFVKTTSVEIKICHRNIIDSDIINTVGGRNKTMRILLCLLIRQRLQRRKVKL